MICGTFHENLAKQKISVDKSNDRQRDDEITIMLMNMMDIHRMFEHIFGTINFQSVDVDVI